MAPGTAVLSPRIPPYLCQTDHRQRCLAQLRGKATGLEKYIYLNGLKERDSTLFYELVLANMLELIPILYTPTVCFIIFRKK
jgi:malate dehydrogenase (oxaloacetate-decarboxylating)(NADP+)